jgi:hypothetical protein
VNPNLAKLQPYPFEKLRALYASVEPNAALSPINLSIGEPKHPTPEFIKTVPNMTQLQPTSVRVSLGVAPEVVLMRGGSAIINPLGQVLAGPHFGSETILTADLDLNDIGRGKFDFDVTGHYSRPDVFQLSANEAPMTAVKIKT